MKKIIATAALTLSLSGCSWVQVTTGGQVVQSWSTASVGYAAFRTSLYGDPPRP